MSSLSLEKPVFIGHPFSSQVNRLFMQTETSTIGDPLINGIVSNPKCEVAHLSTTAGDKDLPGVLFVVRGKPGVAATELVREETEKLSLVGQTLEQAFYSSYLAFTANAGLVPSPLIKIRQSV